MSAAPRSRSRASRRDAAKNRRLGRLLRQQFEGPHLPVHPGQVQHLPGQRQPPHVGLQPGVRVRQVCGDVAEPEPPRSAGAGSSSGPQYAASAASSASASSTGSLSAPAIAEGLVGERPGAATAPRRRPSSGRALRPAEPAASGTGRRRRPRCRRTGSEPGDRCTAGSGPDRAPLSTWMSRSPPASASVGGPDVQRLRPPPSRPLTRPPPRGRAGSTTSTRPCAIS